MKINILIGIYVIFLIVAISVTMSSPSLATFEKTNLAELNIGEVGQSITVTSVVPNDNFETPKVITMLPFSDNINTTSATRASDDPAQTCSNSLSSHTVWYSYTPINTGTIKATILESNFDTVLSVHTGTRGSLHETACNYDMAGGGFSTILTPITAGETVYIMVGSWSDSVDGQLGISMMGRNQDISTREFTEQKIPEQEIPEQEIPEFPTVALPIMAIIGLMLLFQRRKGK
jgi:hypothetical protein